MAAATRKNTTSSSARQQVKAKQPANGPRQRNTPRPATRQTSETPDEDTTDLYIEVYGNRYYLVDTLTANAVELLGYTAVSSVDPQENTQLVRMMTNMFVRSSWLRLAADTLDAGHDSLSLGQISELIAEAVQEHTGFPTE